MKESPSIFKEWIPRRWTIVLLILAMFPHLALLTMFNMNSTFTSSFLDVDVDDLQFILAITYAMLVCGLFVHVRIFHYFNTRSYLLVMTILNILVLVLMSITNNQHFIFFLRFLQGPLSIFEGIILLPILIGQIQKAHARFIAYCCLYCYMLTGDKFTTSLVRFAIENYNYNMVVYVLIGLHVFLLLVFVLLLNHQRYFPKKPLYQINFGGIFLIAIALISGAYALVYGKRLYWFESVEIVWAVACFFVFSGLFVFHQRTAKRPLFYFEVLKSERVIIGILLFFCLYMLRSSMSNVYNIMAVVWHWHWEYVLEIQYFNVAGTIFGIILSYIVYAAKIDFKYIFITGFSLMSITMFYLSSIMFSDMTLIAIAPALIGEGIAQGLLFTPIAIFMYGSVHVNITASALQSGTTTRYWSTIIGFSVMQNVLLYLTTKHQQLMTENLAVTSPVFQQQWSELMDKNLQTHVYNDAVNLSAMSIKTKVYDQALLVSNMEVFTALGWSAAGVVALILVYHPIRRSLGFKTKGIHPYNL